MYGRENYKVQLRHVYWYEVPPNSDKGKEYEPLTNEEIIEGEEQIRKFRQLSKTERLLWTERIGGFQLFTY